MLTLLFVIMMLVVFGKLITLVFKATWGISKILLTFVFLPVVLVCLVIGGLITIAFPLLIIVGIIAFLSSVV